MAKIADRVRETTTTTGTGTYTLAGAVTGFQAFSAAFSDSDSVEYAATDGTSWEVGFGTYSGGTLTRATIRASSNANNAVSWAAGEKDIWCNAPAALVASASISEVATDPGSPSAGEAWVLAPKPTAGLAMGALGMTYADVNQALYYDLSFRTLNSTTKRIRLG